MMLLGLIVSGVYLSMNWYVLARLFSLFALRKTIWFYVALLPLTASFIVALALEARFGNHLVAGFYTLAMLWVGMCFLLLWILLAQQLLSRLFRLPQRVWATGVCGVACGLTLYAVINAHTITVRRERIPRLPLTIAHLSDIHIGSIGTRTLADIIGKTNALRPDVILITGDLFDNANPTTRAVALQLRDFTAPVLFTTGNHEAYVGYGNVRQMLSATPIRWLRNEAVDFHGVRIIGVDNRYGTELLQRVLGRTPASPAFTVLMNHQPTGFAIAAQHHVGLTLSGHVHNGQIWPFNYIMRLLYPYLKGLHANGDAFLNVSTGTGFWGPPMRLDSHSEIVLLEPKL
jgi:predicted MPP superfamily phosphohydrolase